MNYYPPCPQPDKALGLSPHSDLGALTILLQVNEVQGLQIMKDDLWVPITPLANDSFVINIGDTMEVSRIKRLSCDNLNLKLRMEFKAIRFYLSLF
ncbi:Protein SRG1 [Acorus gramineus]|uniref:Protein SRG1 n=1 Tax=Acorus gramineus TaxID=55184 RepID=A0AAV9B8P8_ACOGR|nr:Protein SRG1 [Acorus gramineus]